MYKLLYFHGRWLAENIDSPLNLELTPKAVSHINDALINEQLIILTSSLEEAATLLNIELQDIMLVTPANLIK